MRRHTVSSHFFLYQPRLLYLFAPAFGCYTFLRLRSAAMRFAPAFACYAFCTCARLLCLLHLRSAAMRFAPAFACYAFCTCVRLL